MVPVFYVALHSHFFLNLRHRNQGTLLAKHQKGSFDYFRLSFVCNSGNMLQPGVSNGKFQLKHEKYLQLEKQREDTALSSLSRHGRMDLPTCPGWGTAQGDGNAAPFWPHFSPISVSVLPTSAPFLPISAHLSPAACDAAARRCCSALGSLSPCGHLLPTVPSSQIIRRKQLLCKS